MAYDPSIFNINPYYDDFDGNKGFLRVLFKPGYALQARELTQVQSILQDQLSKIGDHLFKDGSRIVGGGISVRNTDYLMFDVGSGTALNGVSDFSMMVGGTLKGEDGNEARIVHYLEPDAQRDGKVIFVVDFISGSAFTGSVTYTKDDHDPITGIAVPSETYPTSGFSKLVSISDGLFYVDGFFVRVSTQHFSPFLNNENYRDLQFKNPDDPVSQPFSVLSKKIGFYVNRDSVTEQEDPTLRDPSIGSYNYNAPGADRYKIVLTLGQADLTSTPDDFVELLRFENGRITKKIDRISYGDIEKALARRTYDESGSYVVKPFDIATKRSDLDTNVDVSISGGKAYVYGYEVENQHPQILISPKARSLQSENGVRFDYTVGNLVGISLTNVVDNGATFVNNAVTIGSGSSTVKFFDAENKLVASGYAHGAIPAPTAFNPAFTGKVGYDYSLYLYGLSGNVSTATNGYIYLNSGVTVTPFVPSGFDTTFMTKFNDHSSLVFEMKPGYAVESVQSLEIVGKLIGDLSPANAVSVTTTNGVSKFIFGKSHFLSSIPSEFTSSFKFIRYGSVSNPNVNFQDLTDIAFFKSAGSEVASVFVPYSGSIYTDSDQTTITVEVSSVPSEFTLGSIRAVCPIIYTPNLLNPSTFRTKESTAGELTVANSYSELNTDENGRRYYLLDRQDIYAIVSVTNTDTDEDITNDFELDDGQRETHYDFSRLYVKESLTSRDRYSTTNQQIQISYLYFEHKGLEIAPFIGKHSYTNISYDQIPLYTNSRNGNVVSLANCLDFRRKGIDNTSPMLKPYGKSQFGNKGDTIVSYRHYLPRIDKLCVKADPEDGSPLFYFVSGTPDLSPVAPPDPSDGLVIATLTFPSYTHNHTDVVVTPVENKRYTMSDIGKIEKRVDDVEVFAKLSLSELEMEAKSLRDSTEENEPLKTSIFSDELYGHSVADVNDSSFSCSIDYERGELRPFFVEKNLNLPTPSLSDAVMTSDGVIMIDYDHVSYLENKQYTKTMKINPSGLVNWLGFMKLSRAIEPYYDTGYRPIIRTNSLMENDNWLSSNPYNKSGFGTQWNSWESLWTGIEQIEEEQDYIQKQIVEVPHSNSPSAVQSFNSGSARVGTSRTVKSIDQRTSSLIKTSRLKNRLKFSVGSRLVDRSVVPYIPGRANIVASVTGLKPNSENLTLYFDGEPIKTGITTDENGSASVTFGITAGSFLVGSRTVRISDNEFVFNSRISADAVYHCTGVLEQRDSGSFSTRPPEFRRQVTSSETIAKDPFNRDIDSIENSNGVEPLSQTFFVDKKSNPDGIYLSKVALFFSEKDETLPVTIQIRPTVGGYPSPSVVLPFSTVTKIPSEIVAENTPSETEFVFSTPVYLEPGEYSLCVITNSNKYSLYAAETAINTVQNSDAVPGRAGNNQLVGTLFAPQGIGPAVQENLTDIMFALNRCDFKTATATVRWLNLENAVRSQVLKIYSPEIVPTSTRVLRTIAPYDFNNNEAIYLRNAYLTAPLLEYTLVRGFNVSPAIDTQGMYAVAVKMYENENSPSSRYVSRIVELPENLASNGLSVLLDANIQEGSGVRVFYRYSMVGESDILNKEWHQMPLLSPVANITTEDSRLTSVPFTSVSEIDFRQAQYKTTQPLPEFKAYQVRVDLLTNSNSASGFAYRNTPAVRNIKAVSFIR